MRIVIIISIMAMTFAMMITIYPIMMMVVLPPGFAAYARSKDHDDRVAINEGCAPLVVSDFLNSFEYFF